MGTRNWRLPLSLMLAAALMITWLAVPAPAQAADKKPRFFEITLVTPIGNQPREKAGQIIAPRSGKDRHRRQPALYGVRLHHPALENDRQDRRLLQGRRFRPDHAANRLRLLGGPGRYLPASWAATRCTPTAGTASVTATPKWTRRSTKPSPFPTMKKDGPRSAKA